MFAPYVFTLYLKSYYVALVTVTHDRIMSHCEVAILTPREGTRLTTATKCNAQSWPERRVRFNLIIRVNQRMTLIHLQTQENLPQYG